MANTKLTYESKATIAVTTWDSLAAGDHATSAALDNTSDLFDDYLAGGEVAAAATTLAAGESFDVYVSARFDSADVNSYGGGLADAFAAGDSTIEEDVEFVLSGLDLFATAAIEAATPDTTQDYMIQPTAIAQFFGGIMPAFVMWLLHNNTGSAMGTGNAWHIQGITYTST